MKPLKQPRRISKFQTLSWLAEILIVYWSRQRNTVIMCYLYSQSIQYVTPLKVPHFASTVVDTYAFSVGNY